MTTTIQPQDICLAINLSNGFIAFADRIWFADKDIIFTPRGCVESPTSRERVAMANVVNITLGIYPMS